MSHFRPTPLRAAFELSLDPALIEQAREMRINLSLATEDGLRRAIAAAWRAENAAAIKTGNDWVATQGLPGQRR